jgi:DNA topoisomerase IB
LPALRRRIASDVSARGLSKQTVVAAVVQLLETTPIRVHHSLSPQGKGWQAAAGGV